jgi:hypothetical protein
MRPVPAAFMAVLVFAASLYAQNLPEIPVADLAYFHNFERVIAAGSDGDDFLVVGERGLNEFYARRVTAAGVVLDKTGIRMSLPPAAYNATVTGVFWAGDAYTIVWRTQVDTGAGAAFVARIDRDGRVIDAPRLISKGRFFYAAARNGTRIVLAAETLTILDLRGNVLESDVPLPLPGLNNWDFQVASNGSGFMITWTSYGGSFQNSVITLPLDSSGRPIGRASSMAGMGYQIIGSDGNDYIVTFRDQGFDIVQHLSAAGEPLERHTLAGPLMSSIRTIVWNGSAYVVAAQGGGHQASPAAMRLDRTGAPLDAAAVSISSGSSPGYADTVATATNGRQVLITWPEGPTTDLRWFGGLFGSDLKNAAAFPLGITATVQVAPSIATDGKTILTVWEEGAAIYAGRLSLAGERLDGRGVKLSSAAGRAPRAVWDGQTFVVAWVSAYNSIATAHLSSAGALLRSSEAPLFASCTNEFDIATDGDTALVVATQCTSKRLVATRLHRDGMAEPPVNISPAQMLATQPRVAWNGARYLVAWSELIQVPSPLQFPVYRENIRAARVSAAMSVLDPEPLRIAVTDGENDSRPLVASNGGDFLVAWTHGVWSESELRARSVSAGAALGDVSEDIAAGVGTSLVWDGRRFAVAFSTMSADLFLTRIGVGGSVPISETADYEQSAALAPLGSGVIAAAYERVASEPAYGLVPRVFMKTVGGVRQRAVRGR